MCDLAREVFLGHTVEISFLIEICILSEFNPAAKVAALFISKGSVFLKLRNNLS